MNQFSAQLLALVFSSLPLGAPAAEKPAEPDVDKGRSVSSTEGKVRGLRDTIEQANRRSVKIYGAAIAGEHGYGSGIIVSPDGQIVTVMSLILEAADLRVTTHDGHIYQAEVIYRDDYRQLALLKTARHPENVDTTASLDKQLSALDLPSFELGDSGSLWSGDWVFAIGNPFKVAEGDEPLSAMKGIVSGRAKLSAVRGTQPFPYVGEVVLIDAITSGPGSPGSALVDLDGKLVGLIGKDVTSRLTNTLLNYAFPVEEISAFLQDAQAQQNATTRPTPANAAVGYHGIQLSKIGYRKQLPFVRSVSKGSPAEAAGIKPDDLIVSANATAIPRARDFSELCDRLRVGDDLSVVVKRGDQIISLRLKLTEAPK